MRPLATIGAQLCRQDGRGDPLEDPERRRGMGRPLGRLPLIAILGACAFFSVLPPNKAHCENQHPAIPGHVTDTLSPAIGNITIEWATSPPNEMAEAAQTTLSSLRGRIAPEDFSRAMRQLLQSFVAVGYRSALISPRDFVLNHGSLACVLHIDLGPCSFVTSQEFAGLAHTDTVWLRKLLSMPLGVPLTASWINEARQRLQSISCIRLTDAPEIISIPSDSTDREDARLRWHLQESRPVRLDGMVAAGGESVGGLTGRASVQMAGLLRRDRSVTLNYQRMSLARTQLSAHFAEAGAFASPLDWGLSLDESDQSDHRQEIGANLRYGLGRSAAWRIESEGRWRKVTPGTSAIAPSRALEFSLGVSRETWHGQTHDDFDTHSRFGSIVTLSRRREFAIGALAGQESVDNRTLLKWDLDQTLSLSDAVSLRAAALGHHWLNGSNRLGPGDEWYLGGADLLRGYSDREIAAASGSWATLELRDRLAASAAISLFAEGALVHEMSPEGVDSRSRAPYGYGCALWLLSNDRIGRLEFAWRDNAAWRDGLIRLRITQSW